MRPLGSFRGRGVRLRYGSLRLTAAWSPQQVERVRRDTPGVQQRTHLNNAGCSFPPQPVLDTTVAFLKQEAVLGGYETVETRADDLDSCYTGLGKLLNCSPLEIAVVSSATIAWQAIFYGIGLGLKPGDRILTSHVEYASNMIGIMQVCARTGAVVETIPADKDGALDVHVLQRILEGDNNHRVKLIAITHIPTSTGVVNPAAAIGRIARDAGILYLLDACQSVGQMPLDVDSIQCDFLTGTGRKYLRAPRGTGFLYARDSTTADLSPGVLDNWGARWTEAGEYALLKSAKRYETYEMSFAAKAGLAVAVEYAMEVGVNHSWRRIQALGESLRGLLRAIPGVTVHDRGQQLCGIVSFTKEGLECEAMRKACLAAGFNVSVSRRPSTRIDFENRGLHEVVRASVHYYNTDDEIAAFAALIANMT